VPIEKAETFATKGLGHFRAYGRVGRVILGKVNETNGKKRPFWAVAGSAAVPYLPVNERETPLIDIKPPVLQQNFKFFLTKKNGLLLDFF
jgi:hypothetical protein